MRVLQVVTYISPDGSFGGPVRVAQAQCAELARRGHQVELMASSPAEARVDQEIDGYRLRTFPARHLMSSLGFAGLYSPGLQRELSSARSKFDIAHIHIARDLVTMPAAMQMRRQHLPYVLQPHGMIDTSNNLLAAPFDLLMTRPVLRDAVSVLALTSREESDLHEVSGEIATRRIGNGLASQMARERHLGNRRPKILFLARLQSRKRPSAFVEMANLLHSRNYDFEFILAGPDEGEASVVERAIAQTDADIRWVGAVAPDHTDELMRSADVYVLPSVGEVFPMSVLEAFRAGTPVVTTDSLGIAEKCREYNAALVTDGTPAALADAVESLIATRAVREEIVAGASKYFTTELGIEPVVDVLLDTYHSSDHGLPRKN